MCGICGIVKFDPAEPVDRLLVQKMTGALAHRGPDDNGYFVEGHVGLGHRRLSIIDRAGGKQPIFNEDESALIVFNGEVYNYASLTGTLAARGHRFQTRSDTEAIIHAYEEYGDHCVNHLRGMFAFAIWDRRRQKLLLARDRLGIKPLYFYQGGGFLAFASEIKALHEIGAVPREVDPESLNSYLSLRYVPGPGTMFKHIFKLEPGHVLILDEHGVRTRKYWDIEYREPRPRPLSHYMARFEQLLEESVRLRLIAEVPLGVFLSGGLDSSAILAVMNRLRHGERIKTFSVGYQESGAGEDSANEFAYARAAAKAMGSEHHEYHLTPQEFRAFVPDLVWHLDEPLADDSCIPLFYISKLARQHITVVLSGEGADEILAGYGIYKRMLAIEGVQSRFPRISSAASRWLPRLLRHDAAARYAAWLGLPMEARYRGVSAGVRPELKRRLLGQDRTSSLAGKLDALFAARFGAVQNAGALNRMLYVDAKVWLPDDLLLKADKMTMANALELRVPFLDHHLVEFAAALPPHLKLNGRSGKWLLRKTMQGVIPEQIIRRPKKGFPVPTASWLRGPLRGFARDLLLGHESACGRFMDRRVVDEIIREHEEGSANRWQEIWTLVVFEVWHRLFIDRSMEPKMAPRGRDKTGVAA